MADIGGDTKFVKGVAKLAQRIATIRANTGVNVITSDIGDLLLSRTLTRFDSQQDPDGKKWAPLAPATIDRKAREGYGGEPSLVRTGDLRNAIRRITGPVSGTTFTNTGASYRIGVADPRVAQYAIAQNKGTKTIPARRFLGIGALDIKSVDSYLRRQASKAEGN